MRAAAAAPVACLLALLSTAAALPAPSAGSLFGLRGGDALPIEIRAAGAAASPPDANITVDVGAAVRFQETLYGAFFEEIGHAGDGGLFAELVQDRSFDALAAAAGFSSSSKNGARLEVDLGALGAASAARSAAAVAQRAALAAATAAAGGSPHGSLAAARRRHVEAPNAPAVAWSALPGTQTALSRAAPLAAGNPVALEVRPPREDGSYGAGGVVNSGYWGVWLREGGEYGASLFVRNPGSEAANVTLALLSADLETLHARLELSAPPGGAWTRLAGKLRAAADDRDARLAVLVYAPVVLDTVSLFPAENVRRGEAMGLTTPYPFRADLLQRLKDLAPAFLRIPGGCFVEGDKLANAFRWKPTVGPAETRPGHWNLWGYRATDGLGIFEYLLLAEELGARPIWVINAGVAHADSVPTEDVFPWLQDALDAVEFISGPSDSRWGAARAAMGREAPWALEFLAIGNENCGKPFYTTNYDLFYGALKATYPNLTLIANCDLGADAPLDLWDWHVYTNPQSMFDLRAEFDGRDPRDPRRVFASEYAVTDGGGHGNLIGAVAEAGFMTGLERNARAVPLAAYAPLFVNVHDRPWPTNLIQFDGGRSVPIPSFHVQRLFRAAQGAAYAPTKVAASPAGAGHETLAASATCADARCAAGAVFLKVVNFSPDAQRAEVLVADSRGGCVHGRAAVRPRARAAVLGGGGAGPLAENTFEEPDAVAPVAGDVSGLSARFELALPPWSVTLLELELGPPPAAAAAA